MYIFQLVINLVSIFGILVISLLLFLQTKKKLNLSFACFSLLSGIWLGFQALAQLFFNSNALILIRASVFTSSLLPVVFTVFVDAYIGHSIIKNKLIILSCFLVVIFGALGFSEYGITGVSASHEGLSINETGLIYQLSSYLASGLFLLSLIRLIRFSNSKKGNSQQMSSRILVIGFGMALFSTLLAAVVFAQIQAIQLLIPVSFLFLSFSVYYSIAKHHLFDIRLIVARSLAYLASLAFMGVVYGLLGVVFVSQTVFKSRDVSISEVLLQASVVIVIAMVFVPVKRAFDKLTNSLFYRDAYDAQALIDQINTVLVRTIEVEELLGRSAEVIDKTIKATYINFILLGKTSRIIGDEKKLDANKIHEEISKLKYKGKYIFIDELSGIKGMEVSYRFFRSLNCDLILHLRTSAQAIGYLMVGSKKSGNIYSGQDVKVLEILADELALASQNALRFEEIQKFNVTLQQKIEEATRQLRRTNDKLKALDQTKDEFISMASHQLRTPLTSVKGYVSMVLEGDAGKITEQQRKLLDQAYLSSQRMVYLIADLLNVSRLRTGKFVIENKPTQLADLIEGEIAQLNESAKAKNLELNYHKPKNFPLLNMDETKIRQVVMNFADNALYYTQSGGKVDLYLEDKGQSIEFRVVDNGIGVPKNEQHHMFSKFYRAANAQKARPDGTGLGLFMAKKVVVAQGGAIIFKSQEGKGSTFGFSFPKAILLGAEQHLPQK